MSHEDGAGKEELPTKKAQEQSPKVPQGWQDGAWSPPGLGGGVTRGFFAIRITSAGWQTIKRSGDSFILHTGLQPDFTGTLDTVVAEADRLAGE